jgi:hypothetical protein
MDSKQGRDSYAHNYQWKISTIRRLLTFLLIENPVSRNSFHFVSSAYKIIQKYDAYEPQPSYPTTITKLKHLPTTGVPGKGRAYPLRRATPRCAEVRRATQCYTVQPATPTDAVETTMATSYTTALASHIVRVIHDSTTLTANARL